LSADHSKTRTESLIAVRSYEPRATTSRLMVLRSPGSPRRASAAISRVMVWSSSCKRPVLRTVEGNIVSGDTRVGDRRSRRQRPDDHDLVGRAAPRAAAHGVVPMRRIGPQAAVRRNSRSHRFHRRERPAASARPVRHLSRVGAADGARQPRYVRALRILQRPPRQRLPNRARTVCRARPNIPVVLPDPVSNSSINPTICYRTAEQRGC
jgi:hypothetical protein